MWEKCELRCNAVASRTVHSSSEPAAGGARELRCWVWKTWGVVIIGEAGRDQDSPSKNHIFAYIYTPKYMPTVAASQRQRPGGEMLGLELLGLCVNNSETGDLKMAMKKSSKKGNAI